MDSPSRWIKWGPGRPPDDAVGDTVVVLYRQRGRRMVKVRRWLKRAERLDYIGYFRLPSGDDWFELFDECLSDEGQPSVAASKELLNCECSVQLANTLQEAGRNTLGELAAMTVTEFLRLKHAGRGRKQLAEARWLLEQHGLGGPLMEDA